MGKGGRGIQREKERKRVIQTDRHTNTQRDRHTETYIQTYTQKARNRLFCFHAHTHEDVEREGEREKG